MYFLTSILYKAEKEGFAATPQTDRCFGFFERKMKALKVVDENWADMHECMYNWLVVEKISEGLHVIPDEEIWFRWDTGLNKWIHVEKPEWSQGIINWSIG